MNLNTEKIDNIFRIFKNTSGEIRPHFFLTGPSGSSKTHTIESMSYKHDIPMLTVNAAQLTKEGLSGNSLSKALAPLMNAQNKPVVVFVDEFDKLFISGNTNTELAHDSTNGVQNEFLKVLDGGNATVFGEYGKYHEVPADNVLFVFAGAFNGEAEITLERLSQMGVKNEFIGRVGLIFNLEKVSLTLMEKILKDMELLKNYLQLFPDISRETAIADITAKLREEHTNNTLGVRLLISLVHQYFIEGGFHVPQKKHKEIVPIKRSKHNVTKT